MNSIIRNYSRFLDNHNVRYDTINDNALNIRYSLEKYSNATLNIIVSCSSDDYVYIMVLGLGTLSKISNSIYETINNINENKRWGRLYIDDKQKIVMDFNFFIPENNINEFIHRYISTSVLVGQEYYPLIQKMIWGDNN